MKKFEKQLFNLINENSRMRHEDQGLTNEDKKAFLEAVANFHKLGEMVYSKAGLQEVTTTLKSVVERAEKFHL